MLEAINFDSDIDDDAEGPFDDPMGDIILRSSDEVDFRTHKIFLVHASPVFKDMLSLPQGDKTTGDARPPVVVMHENAEEVRILLLLCYPGTALKTPESLKRLWKIYCLADKYMLDSVKLWLRSCLKQFERWSPACVYLIARRAGWREEAKSAAERSLLHTLTEMTRSNHPILETAPAKHLQDLFRYHRQRSEILSKYMDPREWARNWEFGRSHDDEHGKDVFMVSDKHCCLKIYHVPEVQEVMPGYYVYVKSWWCDFMSDCSEALAQRPSLAGISVADISRRAVAVAAHCRKCGPVAQDQIENFWSLVLIDAPRDFYVGIHSFPPSFTRLLMTVSMIRTTVFVSIKRP